jgi:plasmid stability protein
VAQVLVRNIDDDVLERLKTRATHNGRSLQAELKLILEASARQDEKLSFKAFLEHTEKLRAATAQRTQTDSAELLREDRER